MWNKLIWRANYIFWVFWIFRKTFCFFTIQGGYSVDPFKLEMYLSVLEVSLIYLMDAFPHPFLSSVPIIQSLNVLYCPSEWLTSSPIFYLFYFLYFLGTFFNCVFPDLLCSFFKLLFLLSYLICNFFSKDSFIIFCAWFVIALACFFLLMILIIGWNFLLSAVFL
jgi:hypothetical protein